MRRRRYAGEMFSEVAVVEGLFGVGVEVLVRAVREEMADGSAGVD